MLSLDFDELANDLEEEVCAAADGRLTPATNDDDSAGSETVANPQESDVQEFSGQEFSRQEFSGQECITQFCKSPRLQSVRVLKLSNTNGNFRDLGGLVTKHGRPVRYGRIFRHGQLSSLTECGLKQVQELGLKANIDFRTRSESSKQPNQFLSGTRLFTLPISGGDSKLNLSEAVSKVDFSQIRSSLQYVKPAVYRRFATEYVREFQQFAQLLLDSKNYPLSFNCTAGNDRSGWAAAIVYMLLGVSKETIIEDYSISSVLLSEWIRGIAEQMQKHFNDNHPEMQIDMDPIWRLLSVDPLWIEAGFAAVEETWGSMEAYCADGLGITLEQRQILQDMLLEPAA